VGYLFGWVPREKREKLRRSGNVFPLFPCSIHVSQFSPFPPEKISRLPRLLDNSKMSLEISRVDSVYWEGSIFWIGSLRRSNSRSRQKLTNRVYGEIVHSWFWGNLEFLSALSVFLCFHPFWELFQPWVQNSRTPSKRDIDSLHTL